MADKANTHERYDIPNADVLSEDVWADETPLTCPSCGAPVGPRDTRCAECRTFLPVCTGSCSSCASPVCIGDARSHG